MTLYNCTPVLYNSTSLTGVDSNDKWLTLATIQCYILSMNIQKLGHSLARAARWQERYINHHLESFGLGQRTLPFYLTVVHNEGISQKELMEMVVTDKTRTTKAVNHLVKTSYAERKTNEMDNRVNGVYLTDQGRSIFPQIEKVLKRLDHMLSDELSEKELGQFIIMLDAFSSVVHSSMEELN